MIEKRIDLRNPCPGAMNRRGVLAAGLASLSTAALARPAFAQAKYPDRPVRLVVPFSPGGATDVVGRLWAEKMKPVLGTVVTEHAGADPADHEPAAL